MSPISPKSLVRLTRSQRALDHQTPFRSIHNRSDSALPPSDFGEIADTPMKILVAQIGARRHYAVPAALERAGLLAGLDTDVCMSAPWLRMMGKVLPKSCPLPGWKSLREREPVGVPDAKVTCLWSTPWAMWRILQRTEHGGLYARWTAQNEAFCRAVVRRGFGSADSVYAFNGAAVEIFEAAKKRGLKCILDMTIAPLEMVEQWLTEERQRFPGLEDDVVYHDPPEVLIARERREWKLADIILCGSEYVTNTLAEVGVPITKCHVVRWGYWGPSVETNRAHRTGPLTVLTAGTFELRKGVPYILQAARQLSLEQFRFRFVGLCRIERQRLSEWGLLRQLKELGIEIEFTGAIPRSQMTLEYQNADVLLHPSLAEGSANVCYEAMAHGLPVIATPNAGAAITDGVEGLLIPIRDPEAIASALRTLRDDPAKRLAMGQAARERASRMTLREYEQELTLAVGRAHLPVRPEL